MALANEMVLDLTEALKKAEQMDKHLKAWTDTSDKITNKLKKGLKEAIQELKSELGSMKGGGVGIIGEQATASVDKVNELLSSLEGLSKVYSEFRESKGSIIDIGDTSKKIVELEERISTLNEKLREVYQKGKNKGKSKLTPAQQQKTVDEISILEQQLRFQRQNLDQRVAQEQKALDKIIGNAKRAAQEEEDTRYKLALARMDKEIKAEQKASDEKFARQKQNIQKQNEEYARIEERNKESREASDKAKQNTEIAKQQYAEQLKAYNAMFDAIDAREQQSINAKIAEYDKLTARERELQELMKKAKYIRNNSKLSDFERSNASLVYSDSLSEINKIYQKRSQLESELGRELEDIKQKYRTIDLNESVKNAKNIANAELKERKDAAKALEEFKKNTPKDASYLLGLEGQQKSLNELKDYVDELKKTMNSLDPKSKEWEKLNNVLGKSKNKIKGIEESMGELNSKSSNLLNISEQLTRRLALVFSVSQITGYVKKLASVRGEFELQQKSLAAIIQNKDKANEIFDKVTKLAVQSPFQLKELVTYTKQLAAYKIETGKIYDNMKMLADISAGVGVDMSRLVLAYGQVASANYLRGTELRQFSEAGINVLGGLADYFTELYGRVVGVGEVFDMVSRRMVSFADVEEVLRKMTEAGGEFYNMQAIQAQTLRGQISNLKDSIEIMLNEIGKSQEGKLKSGVALVRDLVENWRAFAFVLQNVGFTLAIKGIVDLSKGFKVAKDDLGSFIEEAKGLPKVAASIKNLFFDIQKAIVAHPYIALAAAIAVVGKALWDWNKAVEAQNKVYKENSVAISNEIDRLNKISDKYRKYSAEIITAEAAMQKAKDENNQEEYNKALEESNTLQKEQLRILEQLKKEYPDIYNNLNSEKVSWQELTAEIEKANEAKLTQLALNQGKKGSFWGGDSEGENINDVQDLLNEYYKLLQDAQGELATVNSNLKLNFYEGIIDETQLQKAKGLLDELNNSIANGEDILIIKQKEKAFREYTESIGLEYDNLHGAIKDAYRKWYVDIKNIAGRFTDLEDNWENNIGTYKVAWIEAWKELGEVDTSTEAGKQVAKKYIDSMIGQLESEDKNVQNRFKNWLERVLHTDFDFKITEENIDNKTRKVAWLEAVEDELNAAKAKIPKLTDEVTKEILQKTEGTDLDIGEGFQFMLPDVKDADSKLLDYNEYIKQFKQQWEKIKSLQDKANTKGQALFSKEAVSDINITAKAYEDAARALGILDSKTKNADEKYSEQIRVLKELHKSYIDLNDIFDETASKQGAIEKFGNAFKEAFNVNIDTFWKGLKDKEGLQLDFTTEEGIVAAFDKLIRSIPDQKKRVQAELAKAEFIMEYRIQRKKDDDQKLKDEVQKFFDNYEMKIELDKLGISGDAANALFGIESMDLDKLREKLTLKEGEFIGRGMEKEYKAFQDKLTEMEVKAQQERLEKYMQYTRDAISERAKLELQGAKNLAEIEKTWAQAKKDIEEKYAIDYAKDSPEEIAKKTEEKIDALVTLESSKPQAIEGVRKEMQGALQELDWKEFSSSDTFVSIFNDLENTSTQALTSMIDQLEKYKSEWTDLPIDQMEAIAKQLEKMKNARDVNEAVANPFKSGAFADGRLKAEDISKAQQDMISADESILASNNQISNAEYLLQLLNKGKNLKDQSVVKGLELAKLGIDYTQTAKDQKEILEKVIKNEQKNVKTQKQNKKNAQGTLDLAKKQKAVLEAQSKYLGEGLQMANDLYDAFSGLYEALGGDKDNPVAIFADMGMNMANTVIQTIQLQIQLQIAAQSATGLGVAMNAAMGIIGWIVMAIQLLTKAISAIVKAHDNSLQKQIERDAEAVELLQKRFEKLEEAIDNAMSFGEYQQAFDEGKRNLEEQIRLTEDMIALEEDKKKTDEDAIKGYKDNIEEYNEQLQEMEEKRISDMGGFGSQEAIKDAAMDFVDAWAEAYNETGDGLDALKGKWDEYINNILKKQMMMKVAGKYIQPLLEEVDKMIDDDGQFSDEELDSIKTMAGESSEQLNAIMKQLAEALGWEGGTGGGSELDGLSESIQGVTEVTAQALEAILNSMRFYVIDNNTQLKQLVEKMDIWSNPQSSFISELRNQTTIIDNIYNLFYSVVDQSTKTIKIS